MISGMSSIERMNFDFSGCLAMCFLTCLSRCRTRTLRRRRRGHSCDVMIVKKLWQQGAESGFQMRLRMEACEIWISQSCAVVNTGEYWRQGPNRVFTTDETSRSFNSSELCRTIQLISLVALCSALHIQLKSMRASPTSVEVNSLLILASK